MKELNNNMNGNNDGENTKNVPKVLKPAIYQNFMYINIDCKLMEETEAWDNVRRESGWVDYIYKLILDLKLEISDLILIFSHSSCLTSYETIDVPLIKREFLTREKLSMLLDLVVSLTFGNQTFGCIVDLLRLYTAKSDEYINSSQIEIDIKKGNNTFFSNPEILTYKPYFMSKKRWKKQQKLIIDTLSCINDESNLDKLISKILYINGISLPSEQYEKLKNDVIEECKLTKYSYLLLMVCELITPISHKMTKKKYIFTSLFFPSTVLKKAKSFS